VERGVVNCTGPNKSFDRTRSEEERNSAVFDVNGHVVGFGEATKEKRKSFNAIRRRLIARESSSSCNFYMRNKEE
jgi:predicted RNA-binding protein with PUA domain